MKVSIGDEVILKQTGEEGTVTAIFSHELVEVGVGAVRFPVFVDELEHPYFERFTSRKANKRKRDLTLDDFPSEDDRALPLWKKMPALAGFYISLLPVYSMAGGEEENVIKFNVYFMNRTGYRVLFDYRLATSEDASVFRLKSELLPGGHLYIHYIPFEILNHNAQMEWQLEQHQDTGKDSTIKGNIKLKPAKIFAAIDKLANENDALIELKLSSDFPLPEKLDITQIKIAAPHKPSNIYQFKRKPIARNFNEIDIHIEKLMADTSGLSHYDMLKIQMEACRDAIAKAVANRQMSFFIIHGVGSGKLRQEVHHLLQYSPDVSRFAWKYSQKYGFGATEVFLKL